MVVMYLLLISEYFQFSKQRQRETVPSEQAGNQMT